MELVVLILMNIELGNEVKIPDTNPDFRDVD